MKNLIENANADNTRICGWLSLPKNCWNEVNRFRERTVLCSHLALRIDDIFHRSSISWHNAINFYNNLYIFRLPSREYRNVSTMGSRNAPMMTHVPAYVGPFESKVFFLLFWRLFIYLFKFLSLNAFVYRYCTILSDDKTFLFPIFNRPCPQCQYE